MRFKSNFKTLKCSGISESLDSRGSFHQGFVVHDANRVRKPPRRSTFCITIAYKIIWGTDLSAMYSNDYDSGALMNSYIRWSKRQTISTESEEVKFDEELCSKCKGETATDANMASYPHIQDLCPADRRRIVQLVKQLIKCTKEMQEAKSELAVSESEKEAMKNQYQKSQNRRESDKKQLEFQLNQAQAETNELKTRISGILELLTRQIAAQEKQFLELTETVKDLVREKSRLHEALVEKQSETDTLKGKFQRTKELLEMEKLLRSRERSEDVENVHRACQTEVPEITTLDTKSSQGEFDTDSILCRPQNSRIKSKDDLETASTEGTLLRELFFRKPSVEESGTLDIIPVLSGTNIHMKRSTSLLLA